MDEFFPVRPGGDVAFSYGVLKFLIAKNALDREFIDKHTQCWTELAAEAETMAWSAIESISGLSRAEIERFAEMYASAKSAIFIWSMGLTQHPNGVDNVKSVVNMALARGMVGKPSCGVVPIRGHSGVQGGSECGSVPDTFPGGYPVNPENARKFGEYWGAPIPDWRGLNCGAMLDAAHDGGLDILYAIGGNFLETMPDPARMERALQRVPLRVHQDIMLNSSMLTDAGEMTILLPSKTRYEQEGGGTQTSTERRLRYTPHLARQVGEARAEWEILLDLGERAGVPLHYDNAGEIRAEMDHVMPMYRGIAQLKAEGDSFQYGGPLLCTAPDFVGKFSTLPLPALRGGRNKFFVITRRGTQFNSMIYKDRDAITGCAREDIILNATDAERLSLRVGDAVELTSPLGTMRAKVQIGDTRPGSIQAHWPEANVLIDRLYDPQSGEPDYNAEVTLRKL